VDFHGLDFWGFSRFLVFLFFNGIGLSKGFYVVLIDVWIVKYFYVISPFRFFASILVFSFPSDRLDSLVFSRTGQFFFRTGFLWFFQGLVSFSFGLDLVGFFTDRSVFLSDWILWFFQGLVWFFFRTGSFWFSQGLVWFFFRSGSFGFLKDWSGFSFGLDLLVSFLGLDYWFFGLFGFFPRIGSGLLLDV